MKRIAIIRNAYSHDYGGGERFPVFLAVSLKGQGFEPIILSRHAKLLEYASESDIQSHKSWWWSAQDWSGKRNLLIPIYLLWQCVLFLYYLQLFARYKPDVVHIQSKDDFIAGTYSAKVLGKTVVWTDHADLKHIWKNIDQSFRNTIGKLVYQASKKADSITVVSQSELAEICNNLTKNSPVVKKLVVVHNGCDDVLDEYQSSQGSNDQISYIIASRLVVDKGIGEAIEAFESLSAKYPNIELVIAGTGPDTDKFKKQAENNPRIRFIGHQANPYQVIAKANIFLQPTYHEGFSVVLVEASMLKKPIIATSVGGNLEIIHDGETGLLVSLKDALGLTKAMEKLYLDKELRDKLAQNARRQYEEKFVFDDIVRKGFLPLYD